MVTALPCTPLLPDLSILRPWPNPPALLLATARFKRLITWAFGHYLSAGERKHIMPHLFFCPGFKLWPWRSLYTRVIIWRGWRSAARVFMGFTKCFKFFFSDLFTTDVDIKHTRGTVTDLWYIPRLHFFGLLESERPQIALKKSSDDWILWFVSS